MDDLAVYAGLFSLALVAATILPAQSEAALAALLASGLYPASTLILTASLGNILGSLMNWLLGRGIERFRGKRWFPVSAARLERASGWYHRWGRWSLLFSWAPVVGDPLTVVAGVLREPLWSFLLLVAIAKTARYLLVAGLAFTIL